MANPIKIIQQADGSVLLPEVLRPYLNAEKIGSDGQLA